MTVEDDGQDALVVRPWHDFKDVGPPAVVACADERWRYEVQRQRFGRGEIATIPEDGRPEGYPEGAE